MKGLIISIVVVNLFSVLVNGSPVVKPAVESVETKSEPATESALLYRKSETVAPSVSEVDPVVNDLSEAKKSPVVAAPVPVVAPVVEEVSPVAAEKSKSVPVPVDEVPVEKVATISTTIVSSEVATEKKVKKGKSEKGQVEVVKKVEKVEPVVTEVSDSTEVPVKNEVSPVVPVVTTKVEPAKTEEVKTESTSSDITAYLAEPINQATKLLVDLEEQIKGYLNTDLGDAAASTLSPLSYGANAEEPAIEPSSTDVRQNEQISGMVEQIDGTIANLDITIEDLMANRRYMTAAMMRSMRSYLRGVQNNLQRLQNRLRAFQAVASSASAPPADDGSGTGAFPSNAFFESLRVRVNRITSDITNLMNRMRSTLVSSTTSKPASG